MLYALVGACSVMERCSISEPKPATEKWTPIFQQDAAVDFVTHEQGTACEG